jgi:hypothetical protein
MNESLLELFLVLCLASQDAVRRNPQTCRATDKEVEAAVKVWLKHAKDRLGARMVRKVNNDASCQSGQEV